MSTDLTERYTLITNLSYVWLNEEMRLHCNALLLSAQAALGGPEYGLNFSLRAFGTEAAWDVFDMPLPTDEHRLERIGDADFLTLSGPAGQRGIRLLRNTDAAPRVDQIVGPSGTGTITKVWEVLRVRTRQYWDAPNFPTLHWAHTR